MNGEIQSDYGPADILRIESAGDVLAAGARLPSGTIVVEWNREAFLPEDRTAYPVESRYRCVDDAEEASDGTVVFQEDSA